MSQFLFLQEQKLFCFSGFIVPSFIMVDFDREIFVLSGFQVGPTFPTIPTFPYSLLCSYFSLLFIENALQSLLFTLMYLL